MQELSKKIETIKSKEDFVKFVDLLIQNLNTNPDEWENKSLESYLVAIGSWTEDMEGYFQNNNLSIPENVNWQLFANILMAAKIYE